MAAPAVPVVLLGVLLAHVSRSWTTDRATINAANAAALIADVAISPLMEPDDFTAARLGEARLHDLDARLKPLIGDEIVRIKIWSPDGRVVYSDDASQVGVVNPISDELDDALHGRVSSEISELDKTENLDERRFDRLLEVYAPLHVGPPADGYQGAFELYLPFQPIAASIATDTHRIYLILGATLVLLYLALAQVGVMWARSHRRAEERAHEANHDTLTGLPNRRLFQATLDTLAEGDGDQPLAVMFLDLDDFKAVNDSHGHAVGDALLQAVADRLRGALRGDATLARVGGDEFALIVPGLRDVSAAREIADRLLAALAPPIRIGDLVIGARVSIGIDVTTSGQLVPGAVQRNADVAMYLAKRRGKAQHATFDPALDVSGREAAAPPPVGSPPGQLSAVSPTR